MVARPMALLVLCCASRLAAYQLHGSLMGLHPAPARTAAQPRMIVGAERSKNSVLLDAATDASASGLRPSDSVAIADQPDEARPATSEAAQREQPSFNNSWYAVGFSSQLKEDSVFGMRLWGEPIVLYRDADGNAVCVRDVCPHRSAPLSMGDVNNGQLRCFYHGWGFGAGGKCTDVPTIPQPADGRSARRNLDRFCATNYAVTEHDGMVWVWRGHTLAADASKLPTHSAGDDTVVVDTTFDYDVDWATVFEKNVDAPWLKDDTVAALASLSGVVSETQSAWRSRFDGPSIVRHERPSGLSEEFHIVPIGPERTRVLLRQRLPKGPLLSTVIGIPGMLPLLSLYVKNRNFDVCVEPERGSNGPEIALRRRFREWVAAAQENEGSEYFKRWDGASYGPMFGMQQADDAEDGTYGLKRSYLRDLPRAEYEPMASTRRKQSLLEQWSAAQASITAAALSVPAALITYKTVAPAVAQIGEVLTR